MESRRRRQLPKRSLLGLVGGAAALAAMVVSAPAQADESAYCRKVRARASADASLLMAPMVVAEGIKAPTNAHANAADPTTLNGYQLRAGFTFSPLDFYRGTRVGVVADADCAQHEASVSAQELLVQAPSVGRLVALREQAVFLEAQRSVWEATSAKMVERFAAQNASLLEVEGVRTQSAALERQRARVASDIAQLEAQGLEEFRGSVAALIRQVHDTSMKLEQEVSHVRSLDAWKLNVTGGYLPPIHGAGTSDFYGVVQIGYSLGGPFRNAAETRYLAARDEELSKSRQGLGRQLQVFEETVKTAHSHATRELEVVDRRISEMDTFRAALKTSDAVGAPSALARIELELVAARSEQIFLTGFVRELSRLEMN